MRLNGLAFEGPNEEILVLPRNGVDLVFKARAVLSYDKFDAMCPKPVPKKIKKPSGEESLRTDEPNYIKAIESWATSRTNYTIIESLKATPGLEWEKIKDDDPQSWGLYEEELKKAYFGEREIMKIISLVWAANGVDDFKLEEARKRFLAGQAEQPAA